NQLKARALEKLLIEHQHFSAIFDYHHRRPRGVKFPTRLLCGCDGYWSRIGQWNYRVESRSPSRLTFHGHASAQQVCQPLGKRQAQTCPFDMLLKWVRDLGEFLKDQLMLLLRNSDSRIAH